MEQSVLKELDEYFSQYPGGKADRVASDAELDDIAVRLGINLPEDYRTIIKQYGGIMVGDVPIMGVAKAEYMYDSHASIIEYNSEIRKIAKWIDPRVYFVFSSEDTGNYYALNETGEVFFCDHDEEVVRPWANDLASWIRRRAFGEPE